MRFETVLFDLDGTVVDSGAIILASMRHATREVLGEEYTDAELLQAVGGPGLAAQGGGRAAARARRRRGRFPRRPASRTWCASTAPTTSRCTRSSRRVSGWRTCS